MVADIEIAQSIRMRQIVDVAADLRLGRDDLILKGDYIAKVRLAAVDRARKARQGKLVLVTGTTPTRYGEGKTLTTVGLGQALNRIGTKAIIAVREPSLGPVFGTKGGATGGGRAQVLPMEDVNLHFTGDIHAVGAANNLIAAVMDAHLFHGNALDIDPTRVLFPRCLDMNDRQLRNIVTRLGDVVVTEAGFGSDLGGEKFVDLVCRQSGLRPDAAVLVVSVRALKHHGGVKKKDLAREDLKALNLGFANLDAHLKILQTLGMTPVIAVKRLVSA